MQEYSPGWSRWGPQAQRAIHRQVEERYQDVQDGPGAVAIGGGEWKEVDTNGADGSLKRARSPEDESDGRMVMILLIFFVAFKSNTSAESTHAA